MSRLLPENEQPQMRRFWNGHQYFLNSQHNTKREAHQEAYKVRRDGIGRARVVKVRDKYYVYLANPREKKKKIRRQS